MEEQFRNNLHAHFIISLAAAPSTLKALVEKLNNSRGISVMKVIDLAEKIQCNSVMCNSDFYKKCMVCENTACPEVASPTSPTADTAIDSNIVIATLPGAEDRETTTSSTPRPLISEAIDDKIKNTTKPLGFLFPAPNTVACDVCLKKYVGHEVLERAALSELETHGEEFSELVKAWKRGDDDYGVRTQALCIDLDINQLHLPKFQAVLALLVLQYNLHRPGHHRSCFKLKIKTTCRYDLPKDANMQTTLIINNMEFDKSGNVIFLGDSVLPTQNDILSTADDDTPTDPMEIDRESLGNIANNSAAVPMSQMPRIAVIVKEHIINMSLDVHREIGSEYINRYNPIVMMTFGWNNDMTTMFTSPGIIHYITNYVSKAPDNGATGAATIRAFRLTVSKREREAAIRQAEAQTNANVSGGDTSNPFNIEISEAPSKQQLSQRTAIATLLGVNRTQEVGQNLVAYTALFKTTHLHSHEYTIVQVPQMLAFLRGEPVSGVMSRVSPLESTSNEVDENNADTLAEAAFVLLGDEDDDDDASVDAEEEPANDETITEPIMLSAIPQVHTYACICSQIETQKTCFITINIYNIILT